MVALEMRELMAHQILDNTRTNIDNGNSYFHNGKYLEAVAEYNVVLQINPDNPNILYNKGVSLMKLRRHDEAIACFDKVMEINPNYFDDFNKKKIDNSLLENCA